MPQSLSGYYRIFSKPKCNYGPTYVKQTFMQNLMKDPHVRRNGENEGTLALVVKNMPLFEQDQCGI
jgi:hypothetical protein